jgi:F-type H+-transporting ATPase subunit b
MESALHQLGSVLPIVLAQEDRGLVYPTIGLMFWTVLTFTITMLVLRKFAWPRINTFLEERAQMIRKDVEDAERRRKEADEVLAEYRRRLKEARDQADQIVTRARRTAESTKEQAHAEGRQMRDEQVAAARRDIDAETRRSLDRIRREVADLTVVATEKVTRKSLDGQDHQRLIEEALSEVDFSRLAGRAAPGAGNGASSNGGGSGESAPAASGGDSA